VAIKNAIFVAAETVHNKVNARIMELMAAHADFSADGTFGDDNMQVGVVE
jgi:hypothetical protein